MLLWHRIVCSLLIKIFGTKPADIKSLEDSTVSDEHNTDIELDRCSVKFLLNGGTASFIEYFCFPSLNTGTKRMNSSLDGSNDSGVLHGFPSLAVGGTSFPNPFMDQPIDWSLFDDESLLNLLSGAFNGMETHSDNLLPSFFISEEHASALPIATAFPGEWEPLGIISATITQKILDKTISSNASAQKQALILQKLNYLFTPSRITNLVNIYFETWHKNCPILHRPSFSIETAPINLLTAVIMMGAMYSRVDEEISTAKLILDLAELYIFSSEDLTEEFEIKQMLGDWESPSIDQDGLDITSYQNLSAAYLILCAQFWAGTLISRKRSIETRFGVLIKASFPSYRVARRIGLTKARHDLEDSLDERLWIQNEERIRLMNVMTLLDCAFCFFANFPCRLTNQERAFDLPSEEHIFGSSRPFSEPNFVSSRHLTVFEAYQSLFTRHYSQPTQDQEREINPLALNLMDMFVLIHLLYVQTHNHITQYTSLIPQVRAELGGSTGPRTQNPLSKSSHAHIQEALSQWWSIWVSVRSNIPNSTWSMLGFFRNGINYWLVTQLLISHMGSVDVMMGIEVGCEDMLKHLKELLRDSGSDV
ncbi:uncharacterized protein BP5553_01748 [Venustampulla echinocandica]|uniref:Xylanolytic transcriptional activator regulatory domain-containing protein n=1 Tax=Venustampulla echinocandica TaxID=2656787 RepID=A0A370U1V5_9HELO|nr:uncharacterized protein BP5553_01748 [Venustampulla echinocandica]RDL41769.1 hypothetical protein BP5553_01748 [Venustampulla echinocandica]